LAPDKILLEGMVFYGFHGASSAEQEVGQRFVVDLEVHRDLRKPGISDDLVDTVSYSKLFKLAKDVLEGPRRKLLENVAETIAQRTLDQYPVDAVRVKVMKPEVPIKGSILAHAAVEIFRERRLP
jgi:dihydroneopterin aldolase